MITFSHAEYMTQTRDGEGSAAIRRYYGQFVNEATIRHVLTAIGEEKIRSSRDPDFNDIHLENWVWAVGGVHGPWTLPLARSFKSCGDFPSLVGMLCVAKEAATQFLERSQALAHEHADEQQQAADRGGR
jgi:hypothetical protein